MEQRGRGSQGRRGKKQYKGRGRGRGTTETPSKVTTPASEQPAPSTSASINPTSAESSKPSVESVPSTPSEIPVKLESTVDSEPKEIATEQKMAEDTEGSPELKGVTSVTPPTADITPTDPPPPLVPEPQTQNETPPQDSSSLTSPVSAEPESERRSSFSHPKSETGSGVGSLKTQIRNEAPSMPESSLLTPPISAEPESERRSSFSHPKSETGSGVGSLKTQIRNEAPSMPESSLLTPPISAEPESERRSSFSHPKSESGTGGVGGRKRRLSGIRADERVRRISIGIGGVPKKGYWGGMDDSSDSEDSLLAQTASKKNKSSGYFGLGPKLMGYNRRQWLILIVIAMVDFCSAVLISIQAPIYPQIASAKGVSPTTYGILFGVFELTILLMSPTFFNLLRKFNMKIMLHFGILLTGASASLFSFLDRLEDESLFVLCSFVLRITEAIGDAAILTAAYAIVTLEFPDSVANTFTSLEAFLGIGFIVGPPLAGFLFEANGFMLPFFLFGILLLASGILSLAILPKFTEDNPSGELKKPAFLSLLKIPSVALAAFSILTATISLGFLNATLFAHLSQFMLTAPAIGAIFVLNQGLYCLCAPIWNVLITHPRVSDPKYISLLASVLIFSAFLFVGPAPFMPFDTRLEITCAALALSGIALGGLLVSGFIVIMKDTIEYGFPDNEATFGMSSGLYASVFTFGSFLGLSSSGFLYDTNGFRWACIFPLALQGLLMLVTLFYIGCASRMGLGLRSRQSSTAFEESEPLLTASPDIGKYTQIPELQLSSSQPKKAGSSHGTSTSYESIA